MLDELFQKTLAGIGRDKLKALEAELKHFGEDLLIGSIADKVARALLKGIDQLVAAAVKVLDPVSAKRVGTAYIDDLTKQLVQLQQSLLAYCPLQVAVEQAKHEHGDHSAEANAARMERAKGIEAVKLQVSDVFAAIIGAHTKD